MYAHGDFADFLDRIALFDMTVPADSDYVEYHIPLPLEGLVFVVDPKISINTMEYDGSHPEFEIVSQSGDVTPVYDMPPLDNNDDWKEMFETVIRDEISQWRKHVL